MKNSNPFNGPGTPIARLGQKSDTRIKLVVAAVVVATVFLFSGLFIQGCQRQPATNASNSDLPGTTPTPDAGATGVAATPASTTNTVAAAAPDATTTNTIASSPFPTESATPSAPPMATKDYVVVKGDSFYKIAKAHHITMKALTDANPGTESSKLKVGQTLHVPQAPETATTAPASTTGPSTSPATASAATESSAPAASKPAGTSENKYVVKSGDTLGRIAKAHGTTVKALKQANGLTNDRIAVGKTLKLPAAKAAAAV